MLDKENINMHKPITLFLSLSSGCAIRKVHEKLEFCCMASIDVHVLRKDFLDTALWNAQPKVIMFWRSCWVVWKQTTGNRTLTKNTNFCKEGFLKFKKCITKARELKIHILHATKAMWMGFLGEKKPKQTKKHQKKKTPTKKKTTCPPSGFEISIPNTKMAPWAGTVLLQLVPLCPA